MSEILKETRDIMKKYNIRANKSLGQNFLINQDVVDKIIDSAKVEKDDLVIEIGPGLGTLTKYLLEKAKKVISIELDKKMINILKDRFSMYSNFELLNDDILKINLKQLIKIQKEAKGIKNVKVVANLPYYITTPIIMKLLEEKLDLESITIMIQKEVADRLIATPGQKNTGAITYSVYYYALSQDIMEVPNYSFIPEPDVTSKVIKLNVRKKPIVEVENKQLMFKIIKSAFMQRRKTLLNSLRNANIFKTKEEAIKIIKLLDLDENIRAEQLSLNDFAEITNKIIEKYH